MSSKSHFHPAWLALALYGTVLHAQNTAAPAPLSARADQPAIDTARPSAAAEPESEIRIVRLSQVRGDVKLDRKTGNGLETAFANLPVIQGARLETGTGIAEVEFEDNSTLRLAPNTLVEFSNLGLRRSGTKDSRVLVLKGTAFLSRTDAKDHDLTVAFAKDQIILLPGSHIELHVADPDTRLSVLNGVVQVEDPAGNMNLAKKKSLLFDPASGTAPKSVAFSAGEGPLASWDKDAVSYHNVRAYNSFGSGTNLYGSSDLAYYGSFSNLGGGCGNVWRPYFASAGWDPFANGVYAWYPGAGYSWVSPYPWGWTPFHSGSWQYCGSGAGWGWQPGGHWNGLRNLTLVTPATGTSGGVHPKPPAPPSQHGATMVVVATRPLSVSQFTTADKFVLRNDSAGLGVPREAFNRLDKLSTGVAQHGSVTTSAFNMNQINPAVGSAQGAAGPGAIPGPAQTRSQTGYSSFNNTSTHNESMPSHSAASAPSMSSPGAMGGGKSK